MNPTAGGKRGQIWVETVIYTLIAFVIIGLVLAYARPKIEELQDKTIIEQSLSMLKDIDSIILTMTGAGNQRVIELGIKKGNLKIDGVNDDITFEIDSKHAYSEPGSIVYDGDIAIQTVKKGSMNFVNLTRDFTGEYDITYNEENKERTITESSTSYKILISNKGLTEGLTNIDFKLI